MGSVLHSKNPAEGVQSAVKNPAAGYRLTRSKRCITQSHAVTRATIRVFPAFRRLIRASCTFAEYLSLFGMSNLLANAPQRLCETCSAAFSGYRMETYLRSR